MVARKWRTQPEWRTMNAAKMSQKVSSRINQLMQSEKFKTAWKKKAQQGSKNGLERLKQLMEDPTYQDRWKRKCEMGGKKAYADSAGIFAKKNAAAREAWAVKGLSLTGRKILGPYGERMYNALEKKVATILQTLGIPYTYEKRFCAKTLNGFFSVDFFITGGIAIEATYWDKVEEKSKRLNKKYRMLKRQFHRNIDFFVVTRPNRVNEYRRHLEKGIKVCGPQELHTLLASIAG